MPDEIRSLTEGCRIRRHKRYRRRRKAVAGRKLYFDQAKVYQLNHFAFAVLFWYTQKSCLSERRKAT